MLVISVRFLNASGSPSIPLVTGRTAELVRIMGLQQFRLGMAGERPGIVVGLFPFWRHRCGGQLDGLAGPHVAGFAAIHNIGLGHIDLQDRGVQRLRFVLQTSNLCRRQVHHVLRHIPVELRFLVADWLDQLAQFRA